MATNKLKVEDLRAQLAQRGLSTAGIRPNLVRRLEAAIRKEEKEEPAASSRKRRRDSDDDSEAPPQKLKTIDELQSMNVKQLREEAEIRGVSTVGTKKELLERLSVGESVVSSDHDKATDETMGDNVESSAPRKIKTADELELLKLKLDFAGLSDHDKATDETMGDNDDSSAPRKIKTVDELQTLNLKQLREEAGVRGISTAGTKKDLLQRLSAVDEAVSSDQNEAVDETKGVNVDSSAPQKMKTIDELQILNVKQLREEAEIRGLSTGGTKKELLERLSVDDNVVSSDHDKELLAATSTAKSEEDEGDADSRAPQKFKTVDELQTLNLKQLREEAVLRGISAAGTKKDLLERLCSDNNSIADDNDQAKEETKDGNDDSSALLKMKSNAELQTLNVKQLREEAAARGVSTVGTKKELLERLSSNDENNPDEIEQVKVESKKEKLVTATKKGSAVLDIWLPDQIKTQYHVLQVGDEIYDAMLNQTNVGQNNNKFYLIQVLESDDGSKYMVYYRWGRVGIKGQDKLSPCTTQQSAISEFEKKFQDKTKNNWTDRKDFVSYPGTYTWIEMDYGETNNEPSVQDKGKSTIQSEPRESKLEAPIAKFISLICNISMMKQQMMEIGYNAEKLPLGKLSKSTILKGYEVLKRIADVIHQSDRKTLELLSGEFFSVIPHDFGFKKTSLFIIDTPQKLKTKLEMVEALGEIEVATKLLQDDIDMEDPLYSQYKRLNCDLMPLEVSSKEFSMIEKYTKNTHAKTHSSYNVDIVQIFKVSREGEAERFKKFSETNNRMLLWHGSRLSNWTGILSQGLRIAPPEAPVTGYMFGKGVYFADMFSKSANYCYTAQNATSGVLLLCEVALGDMVELREAKYNADKLPYGKLSTKGVGSTAPDLSEVEKLEDGVIVPLGIPKQQPGPKGSLQYNEYIVYNVDQIRMRYLVQVNFNFKRW